MMGYNLQQSLHISADWSVYWISHFTVTINYQWYFGSPPLAFGRKSPNLK